MDKAPQKTQKGTPSGAMPIALLAFVACSAPVTAAAAASTAASTAFAAAASAPPSPTLLYSTCSPPGACTSFEVRSFDTATRKSAPFATLPPNLADFWFSNSIFDDAAGEALLSLQHPTDFSGALVSLDTSSRRVASAFNASRCVSIHLDPADATRDTVACVSVLVGGACGAGVECLELRHLSRSSGADALVAAFARGDMPVDVGTFDAKRGVILATFEPVDGGGNATLVHIDPHSGRRVREVDYAFTFSVISMQYDAARARVLCVAEDIASSEVFFGELDPDTATATPIRALNESAWAEFSPASALAPRAGLYYMAAFSSELHLLGLRLSDGAVAYDAVVEQPFTNLLVISE